MCNPSTNQYSHILDNITCVTKVLIGIYMFQTTSLCVPKGTLTEKALENH